MGRLWLFAKGKDVDRFAVTTLYCCPDDRRFDHFVSRYCVNIVVIVDHFHGNIYYTTMWRLLKKRYFAQYECCLKATA